MVCRYCGLETGSGVGHRSQAECIQALNAEIERAKRLMSRVKEAERGGAAAGDRDGPTKERASVQMT